MATSAPSKQLHKFTISIVLLAVVFATLVIIFTFYVKAEKQIDRTNELRLQSYLLADELRQSSDDLTRMVRTYVSTGNPVYKQHYQEILDICDGRKPRPVQYHRIYWDYVFGDEKRPRPGGEAVALLELMRQAGFSQAEFAALEQAKTNSDKLTIREFAAMELVEPTKSIPDTTRLEAILMLNDEPYLQAKAGIMHPINEFFTMMDVRTSKAVKDAEQVALMVRYVVIILAVLLVYLLWRSYRTLYSILGCKVDELKSYITHIGSGDFSFQLPALKGKEDSVLGWLSESKKKLAQLDSESKRAKAEVLKLNDELEEKVIARTRDLEQAKLEAEQASRAKSEFLATMSHEIRTPMNGVIGMIDVLQQSSLNPQQMEIARVIQDSAYALLSVINDILDFSKIEAGKLQIDLAAMNIVETVEGVGDVLERFALEKKVELMLFVDPNLPEQIMGDSGRVRQILINLANNAIKFSSGQPQQGKVALRALLFEKNQEKATLDFLVKDNGVGIDKATQARLFTPFTQADSSTTRTFGGSGLGLVITRQLARLMGGEVTMHSERGKGTELLVRIPFDLLPEKAEAHKHTSPITGLNCLVADGDENMADDLAVYLKHEGAWVERAKNLTVTKQWLAAQPPGLCIVVIDTAGVYPPLAELREAARSRPGLDARFVVIGRGTRRKHRAEAPDLVTLDAEIMHRRALTEAVAFVASLAKEHEFETMPGTAKSPTWLSREEARQQGRLILIAEDNEINQKVILQQLALLGRTADIASTGREALQRWQSGDYGILLTDLHMPEMDGYELATAIRAEETGKAHLPIIAFTANALKGEADHCLAVGMDDYLSKPVQLVNLKAMLEKWMPVAVSLPVEATAEESNRMQGAPLAVDVNVLRELIGDDEAMIREFLHDFRRSAEKTAAELRAACAAGQATDAGALAHKLKSSARSVGALALGELCAAMEKAGKGGDAETMAALLSKFEQELASVEHCLEEY